MTNWLSLAHDFSNSQSSASFLYFESDVVSNFNHWKTNTEQVIFTISGTNMAMST
jgi:hypothetical protein